MDGCGRGGVVAVAFVTSRESFSKASWLEAALVVVEPGGSSLGVSPGRWGIVAGGWVVTNCGCRTVGDDAPGRGVLQWET